MEVKSKRVHRIWRREHLHVRPKRKRRRGSRRLASLSRRPAGRPNHIWAWDLIAGEDDRGRKLIWLSLVDEYTRECLALEVARQIAVPGIINIIQKVLAQRTALHYVRSDNDQLWNGRDIRRWLLNNKILALYIAPGYPCENGYVESFQSHLRDELLDCHAFAILADARATTADWLHCYNHHRPHSALGYLPPAKHAAAMPSTRRQ